MSLDGDCLREVGDVSCFFYFDVLDDSSPRPYLLGLRLVYDCRLFVALQIIY